MLLMHQCRKPLIKNNECYRVNYERKQALRRYQRSGLIADKITYKRVRAIAQFIKNKYEASRGINMSAELIETLPSHKYGIELGRRNVYTGSSLATVEK